VAPFADTDPVFGEEIGKLFGQPYDLLLGRRTYDIFAAFWPYAEGGAYDDIAKQFNRITKYVATRKGADLTRKGSVALRDGAKLEQDKAGEEFEILSRSNAARCRISGLTPSSLSASLPTRHGKPPT
jgi:hypothetical protein